MLKRFIGPLVFLTIVFIIFKTGLEPIDFKFFKDILLATTSLAASLLGFLIATITIIQSLNGNKYFKKLIQLGTAQKLLKELFKSITALFGTTIISLFFLFFDFTESTSSIQILFSIWMTALLVSLFLMAKVIFYVRYVSLEGDEK
ncbi:hypothetical protein BTO30_16710 [Domibacillus antri]|uniref:Uncharacterized protein n=1 Tax=Domibacillus antri TaxID=1714264 RepID=A0A1Q8Q1C8_9BACI|nr:hypothetical protein [Domibacillus antri]OLN21118.1 hypothetical protein BTO30_16710 [Domibacillus antri]